ncbi:MAG: AAA family ATPase [Sulfurimonas sp. RIFCSPLOWO2_12_36_12]|uniref:AAA family ATPase n=1 Tax=Sulfurimonas sp. RIFCSPLOWO2_12_36_12 TaxID=1802253 RepID=UPI0008B5AB76|nr:AAA family ATPase [Sulfurimonas sp. RIFCSPLOWO2_12_36_12]OHE00712.1 MAG: AAA family ATPase [Sulfurimonas sp. RIFCSPLOWO2_02_FULL_36_28]OHE02041.1 MAG: AAA family ATPase [Sulfurimonas sp. RIFCSPLOWO2_12_36_12]
MRKKTSGIDNLITYKKTDFIDADLIDKASLWILRILLNLGGHREFLDKNNYFSKENILHFLGLGKYAPMHNDEYTRNEIIDLLKNQLVLLEKKNKFTTSKILAKNIKQLSSLMQFNSYEEQILEFVVLVKQYEILDDAVSLIGNNLNSSQAKKALSVILNIPRAGVERAFLSDSKFIKSSLITIEKNHTTSLDRKFDTLNNSFLDNMLNLSGDITEVFKDSLKVCGKSILALSDYDHVSKDLEILLPYLKNALQTKQYGVNILLYGLPGTGKTELAKVLSSELGAELFEVSYTNMEDEPIDGSERVKAYKSAQSLLSNKNTLLIYDEAEDIFESSFSLFMPQRQKDKAWINKTLETNTIPTIWITNNIDSIDNAIVRRFDLSIELPIPSKSKREEIVKNHSNNLLDAKSIKLFAEHENIAPAVITRALKVVQNIGKNSSKEAFAHIINNTLKAQGYREIKKENNSVSSNIYNPDFVNTTTDLSALASGIKQTGSARLCLYGAAGTGKSAFGKYIADVLDKPLLLKKGSDLMSKWLGETEKNIANAFREAEEENAVLLFDEVDSFLGSRENAKASWEITQVNEMLVQMENFNGVFIATTNLMDNLDRASLRRFDLKLEFGYLKPEQAWNMFLLYAKELKFSKPTQSFKTSVSGLRDLTPGDFAAVVRQNRFRPIKDIKDFISRLQDEIAVKNISTNKMGFL